MPAVRSALLKLRFRVNSNPTLSARFFYAFISKHLQRYSELEGSAYGFQGMPPNLGIRFCGGKYGVLTEVVPCVDSRFFYLPFADCFLSDSRQVDRTRDGTKDLTTIFRAPTHHPRCGHE